MGMYLSISQLKSHEKCPVKWVLEKLVGLRSPSTEATDFGSRFHADLERFLTKSSSVFDLDETRSFYELWMKEQPNLQIDPSNVEIKFNDLIVDESLPPFVGAIDVFVDADVPMIIDHKTVGNAKFALNTKNIKHDPQLMLYAYYILTKVRPEATHICVQHNQYLKRNKHKRYKLVSDVVDVSHVMTEMEHIKEMAHSVMRTKHIFEERGIDGVRKECSACQNAFGGCPYKPICDGLMSIQEYLKDPKEALNMLVEKNEEKQIVALFTSTTKDDKPVHKEPELLSRVVELMPLYNRARVETQQDAKNQFEHRKLIADKVVQELAASNSIGVSVPMYLTIGSDPDITPTLAALDKEGFSILHFIVKGDRDAK